jgi:hypothetical protein
MLYVILYFKLRNFVISQSGIRNIVLVNVYVAVREKLADKKKSRSSDPPKTCFF